MLGDEIVRARIRLAMSQEALASLMSVSQQTVSRWETGQARPRKIKDLAQILQLDLGKLVGSDGRPPRPASVAASVHPDIDDGLIPVQPRLAMLPFHALPAERFEECVADLFERMSQPGAKVSRLGGQGEKQGGFDLLIDRSDRSRVGVQCKREKQFGPEKVKEAVKEAELTVDQSWIALARVATVLARLELDKHVGWQMWDRADMSRAVRRLDRESAYQFVSAHFPDHVEPFLGLKKASPWVTAEEFYPESAVLDHRHAMFGRGDLVNEVTAWACAEDGRNARILVGRGGLGKSKLLWEVAGRAADAGVQVRFLAAPATAEDYERLPLSDALLVVIDEAMEYGQPGVVLSLLWQIRPYAKVLLATRPHAKVELETELWSRVGDRESTPSWELTDLSSAEARDLASTLLRLPAHNPFVSQLAAASRDCPFIAVVAADLVHKGRLAVVGLASESDLRRRVLQHFVDQMLGPSQGTEGAHRRRVLESVALFQPVRLDDPNFQHALTQLSELPSWDEVRRRISELEDAGLILRRDRTSIRAIPDMFADVLIGDAAHDSRTGVSTSFLPRARAAAHGVAMRHLVINASRIDWQLRDGGMDGAETVQELWDGIREELLAADLDTQVDLLKFVSELAYFQPRASLRIVDDVLAQFVADESDTVPADVSQPWSTTHADVIAATVPVLRSVAHHLEFLREALDRLWAVAQSDHRPTNQNPDHPLRVLQEIVGLTSGKPTVYIDGAIDAAVAWLTAPYEISPFEVLDQILATEGTATISYDETITFYRFGLNLEAVRPLRQRVIDLATEYAASSDLAVATRAIKTLGAAISGPIGSSRPERDDGSDPWTGEFLPVIKLLGSIGRNADGDPLIQISVRDALNWHARYSTTATKEAAVAALHAWEPTLEEQLDACLDEGWSFPDVDSTTSIEQSQRDQSERFRHVADQLCVGRSDDDVLDLLERRIAAARSVGRLPDASGRFIQTLFAGQRSAADRCCQRCLNGDLPELATFVGIAIETLLAAARSVGINHALAMLAGTNEKLQVSASLGLAAFRTQRSAVLPDEVAVLRAMATHANMNVRALAGRCITLLGLTDKAAAVDLLTYIDFESSRRVAEETFRAYLMQGSLDWPLTPPPVRAVLLDRLVAVASIDSYEIMGALSKLSEFEPHAVIATLTRRIDRQDGDDVSGYDALPYRWAPPLRIDRSTELRNCLAEIKKWILHRRTDGDLRRRIRDDESKLYELAAGGWNEEAIATLGDFVGIPSELALLIDARLLAQAPVSVLCAHQVTIAKILRTGQTLGEAVAERTMEALVSKTGIVFSWSDGSLQADLELVRATLETLPTESPEHQFFTHIADGLAGRISWGARIDSSSFDSRQW